MLKYLLKRSGIYLIMIFLTTSAGYFLAVSTLKPALLEQEKIPRPTPEQVSASFRGLGLDPDANPWQRYVDWLGGIITRWDWGRSPNGAYVNAEFADRVMVSTRLFIASIILTLIIGVALGVYSAARQYKFPDRLSPPTATWSTFSPRRSPTSWCSWVPSASTRRWGSASSS